MLSQALKDLAGSWDKSSEAGRVKERLRQLETDPQTRRPEDPAFTASLKREYVEASVHHCTVLDN
jgi:hypothetical protein